MARRRAPGAFNYHDLEKARGLGAQNIPDLRATSGRREDRAGNSYRDREFFGALRHGRAFS
jgi:hypothetical protein